MRSKTFGVSALLAVVAASAVLTREISGTQDRLSSASVIDIEIKTFQFNEDTIRVQPGTSVRWTNRDQVGHTSTAENGEWESPLLGPGESFEFLFEEEGEFPYTCTPHPFMRGMIIVASDADARERS
jgi:plastocyanin